MSAIVMRDIFIVTLREIYYLEHFCKVKGWLRFAQGATLNTHQNISGEL